MMQLAWSRGHVLYLLLIINSLQLASNLISFNNRNLKSKVISQKYYIMSNILLKKYYICVLYYEL